LRFFSVGNNEPVISTAPFGSICSVVVLLDAEVAGGRPGMSSRSLAAELDDVRDQWLGSLPSIRVRSSGVMNELSAGHAFDSSTM